MSIEFKEPAEAICALASVMIAADSVGNFSEHDFLLTEAKKLDVFKTYDATKFNRVLGNVTERMYDTLPCENGMLTEQGVQSLLAVAKKTLNANLQKQCFQLVAALACSDGLGQEEAFLLTKIQKAFGIDPQFVKKVCRQYDADDDTYEWKKAA